jgi:hypothetical protein
MLIGLMHLQAQSSTKKAGFQYVNTINTARIRKRADVKTNEM